MIVCKYKFDKSIYSNLIPIFNDGYNGYTVSDEIDSENSNHVIRTIECDTLPTLMIFGREWVSGETNTDSRTDSLLEVLDMNTSELTSCNSMFRYNTNLTSINCNWDTSNVTSMCDIFANCHKLTSLDVSNWDTSNVTDMSYMFAGCYSLTSLDVSNWDTSNVTTMYAMINNCHSLTSLDVSNWDTSNVTDMQAMFADSYLLSSLDMSNWSDNRLNTAQSMFDRCNLHSLLINNFNIFKTVTTYSSFNGSTVKKLYVNDKDIIQASVDYLPSRVGEEPGYIVTALRDQIDDETKTALATKNWEIVDIVAQYRYDANTYENLIPEFNTEFSSDKYEVNDSVSEIVIDNIKWMSLPSNNYPNNVRSNYIPVLSNITYNFNCNYVNVQWLDKDKKEISNNQMGGNNPESYVQKYLKSPINAKYLRVSRGEGQTNITISAKLITRSIESVNGDLPTQMYFGNLNATTSYYTGGFWSSLLRVYGIITSSLTTMRGLFRWCDRLTSIDGMSTWDTSNVVDMGYLFDCCYSITSLDVSNFNTSEVTTMNHMFNTNSQALTSLDVSNFNTSNVTSMGSMFANCYALTSLNVSNFNTSKVTTMINMFYNCQNLTTLDVSNFNTSKVTTMGSMFHNCKSLTSLDVSNFNTSNVADMRSMFDSCNNLTSLDVSNFDTSNITSMYNMFRYCYNLTTLDVSNFNTSKVTTMEAMFYYCNKLKNINICNWDFGKVTNIRSMFSRCYGINIIDAKKLDFTNCINNIGEFIHPENCTQLKYFRCDISNTFNNIYYMLPDRVDKEQGVIISDAEISEEILTKLTSKNWTVITSDTLTKVAEYVYDSKIWRSMIPTFNDEFIDYFIDDVEDENGLVTRVISSMGGLPTLMRFGVTPINNNENVTNRELSLLEILDINTNEMTTGYCMFFKCNNLSSINIENFNTSNITSMQSMFRDTNLTSLDVSNFNTSNVTNMSYMFNNCNKLTSLDVSNWDTSNVTNMQSMFNNCNKLTSLDLSNFDTSNVTNMGYMFDNCNKLTSLDLSNFNTSKLTSTERLTNRWWYPNHSIGMLYCDKDTINKLIPLLKSNGKPTIYVKDVKPNELTSVEGIEFKEYKENSVMINLSSPLLQGDRIEVVDGKLCHYHKMISIVLNGSESWKHIQSNNSLTYGYIRGNPIEKTGGKIIADKVKLLPPGNTQEGITISNYGGIYFHIDNSKLLTTDANGFRQYLSENPTTVIYELAEPYYEDITPLQSDVVLETYLECNLDIYTKLPIKANVSYITNVPSLSTLSMRATEMKESDNIIANLTNMLDNEINE